MPREQIGQIEPQPNGTFHLRWHEPDGSRPRKTGFATKKEARTHFLDHVRPRLERMRNGEPVANGTTLNELVELYLEAHGAVVTDRTIKTLRERLVYATAKFGERPIDRIMPAEVAAWSATLPPAYRPKLVQAFRQVLGAAVRWRMLTMNAAFLAGPIREHKAPEIVPFTREQVAAIADEIAVEYAPLVTFAVETGLRPEEWAALERGDVDRTAGVVTVTRKNVDGKIRDYVKTDRSRRRVTLTDAAMAALDSMPPRLDTRLLWTAPKGGLLILDNFRTRDWYPALEAAGVPKCGPYTMRHTCASDMLAAGFHSWEVARELGTSVKMIDQRYGHLVLGSEESIRERRNAYAARRAS